MTSKAKKKSKINVENNEYYYWMGWQANLQLLPFPLPHFFDLKNSYLIKLQVTILDTSISIGPQMIFYLWASYRPPAYSLKLFQRNFRTKEILHIVPSADVICMSVWEIPHAPSVDTSCIFIRSYRIYASYSMASF